MPARLRWMRALIVIAFLSVTASAHAAPINCRPGPDSVTPQTPVTHNTSFVHGILATPTHPRRGITPASLPPLPADWYAYPPVQYREFRPGSILPGNASTPFKPAQIRGAYGLDTLTLPNSTGAGVTIAIVDAYGDTNSSLVDLIQTDLQQFCTATGLPYSGPSTASPTLTEAFPSGNPTASNSSWAIETALDVEWVHAMAPDAHILLVVSPDNGGSLYTAVQYASAHSPIVSMSWGGSEFSGETSYDLAYFSTPGVSYFASTGDYGAGVMYPSASPNVTAVGGTALTVSDSNGWVSETAWSGSGGGVSSVEAPALFQSTWVPTGNRSVPDIAAVADPNTGVYVVQNGAAYQVGGTSLSCPLWAGFTGIVDGNLAQPLTESALHAELYNYGNGTNIGTNFHDIVSGSNGFSATTGYDLVTGIGSPLAAVLLPAMVNTPVPSAPVITSATSASGNNGSLFTYQIVATNTPTSYSATGLPNGLTINTVTGLIFGTPTAEGVTNATITAKNASGTANASLAITINSPLPTPVITSSLDLTGTVGVPLTYTITATNQPTSFIGIGFRQGLAVDNTTGKVNDTPVAPGTYTVTIGATNVSGTGTATLNVTINPATPQVIGPTTAAATVGHPFSYQISALNDPASFNATGLPAGLTVNLATGVISGTPTTAGQSTVALSATNVTGTGGANLALTVGSTVPSTITVTNTDDIGTGSLRAAITAANAAPGSTIVFQSGLTGTILLGSALPTILADTTIQGPGAGVIAIDGAGKYRIFRCGDGVYAGQSVRTGGAAGGKVSISGLTLQNGSDQVDGNGGGAVMVTLNSSLTISDCILTGCTAQYFGPEISNAGVLSASNCTLSNSLGPAPLFNFGLLDIADSTITGNTCSVGPPGVYNGGVYDYWSFNAVFHARNCVFSGNSQTLSNGVGGVFRESGVSTLDNCSLVGNTGQLLAGLFVHNTTALTDCILDGQSAHDIGAAMQSFGSLVTFDGCTIANTSSYGPPILFGYGTLLMRNCTMIANHNTYTLDPGALQLADDGYATLVDDIFYGNPSDLAGGGTVDKEILFETIQSVVRSRFDVKNCDVFGGFTGSGNINADPMLAPLANYGGPTQTMALLPGSPCLGAGIASGVLTDQRGVSISQQGRYDIGAFESQGFNVTATSGDNQSALLSAPFASPLTATVSAKVGGEPVIGGIVTFTAPANGASATLAGSPATIAADGSVSATATANATAGAYIVSASTRAGTGSFHLTNSGSVPVLTATPGAGKITLNWTAIPGATYNIYRATTSGAEGSTALYSGLSVLTKVDSGLSTGTVYYYQVAAIVGGTEVGRSNEVSATPSANAIFVKTDVTTHGNWKGVYGGDGYNVFGDSSAGNPNYGTYATVTPGSRNTGVWSSMSLLPGCLEKSAPGSVDRMAGVWYQTSWTMNVNIAGTHQLALYLLDFPNAGYVETITIKDAASGATLDTRTASSFAGGAYYVWNVSGNVTVTFKSTAGHWAVLSGIFLGPGAGGTAPAAPSSFKAVPGSQQATLSWAASPGATSYSLYRGTAPGAENITPVIGGITGTSRVNVGLTAGATYYYKVVAFNAVGASLASTEASAAIPTSTAAFVKADTATQGNWKGNYGGDGFNVIGDTGASNGIYPSYATLTPGSHNAGLWSTSPLAPGNLQQTAAGSAGRVAGLWYQTSWSMSLNVTGTHQLALYLLDFPNAGYAETITIKDRATGAVLDTRSASSFAAGVYYVWNVSGNISITFTSTAGHWAPISGIFFGPSTSAKAPGQPTGVTATPGVRQTTISWSPTSGAASYNVYRGTTAGGESTTPVATGITGTSYVNNSLTTGVTYYYKVIAVNATGGSKASAEASALIN